MKIFIYLIISLSFVVKSDEVFRDYLKKEIELNSLKDFETIVFEEKVSFDFVFNTLKGVRYIQNDGSVSYSGTKEISQSELKKLQEKYSKNINNNKWLKKDYNNLDVKILNDTNIKRKVLLDVGSKFYIYYLSDVYITCDNKYKFYSVGKNSYIEYDRPISSCVFLYKKNNQKWELIETINSTGLY